MDGLGANTQQLIYKRQDTHTTKKNQFNSLLRGKNMSAKSDLKHSIIQTTKHNKDGSFKTQGNRKERLLLMADQLAEGGYKIRHIQQ